MDVSRDDHTKQSKSEKDKYRMIITDMWNLKHDTNQHTYKTETGSQIQRAHLGREMPHGKNLCEN